SGPAPNRLSDLKMSGHPATGKHARMALTRMLPSPLLPSPRAARFQPGPLAGRYPAAAAMVVLFLTPYLGLSSALQSVAPIIAAQLHMSLQAVNLTSGLANAGYAAGTVLAGEVSPLPPPRRGPVGFRPPPGGGAGPPPRRPPPP